MVTNGPNLSSTLSSQGVASDRTLIHEHDLNLPGDNRVLIGRSYISWGAVIAGALTSLALLILSGVLAYACGVPAYQNGGPFGAGAGIWMVVSSIIAFFVGGCLVAYLSPHSQQRWGVVHGMMAWVLGIILMATVSVGTLGFFHGMNILLTSYIPAATEMTHAQLLGVAWSSFIAMALGLVAAVIGGIAGYNGRLSSVE